MLTVSTTCTSEHANLIKQKAKENGEPVSHYVRRALAYYLNKEGDDTLMQEVTSDLSDKKEDTSEKEPTIERLIFIDYENVHSVDFTFLPNDEVFLFLGVLQTNISLKDAMIMHELGERGHYIPIGVQGPNALDFCLAYTVGKQRLLNPYAEIIIISNDRGFDSLMLFLDRSGAKCQRVGKESQPVEFIQQESLADQMAVVLKKMDGKPKFKKNLNLWAFNTFSHTTNRARNDAIKELFDSRRLVMVQDRINYYL